ncbi:MAG: hypothetical protein H7Y20_19220 [Bryobacteraceae bacterium]|nr:hypothetical protein [Bryobacteraceae bacterium]
MRNLTATLLFAAAIASGASMTGYISDASCGAANANAKAESRDCAKSCIKSGATPVFVSDVDQKVYKLAGKDVKAHLDYKVKITGEVNGETITVQDIRKAD